MDTSKAKTMNLLLYNGTLDGVLYIESSSWNAGELYSAPRDAISDLISTGACSKSGVYLLWAPNKVYIGQSHDLAKRLNRHIIGKDWWKSAVILATKGNSLTHTDIDYLEAALIAKASAMNHLDCDNKNKGNPTNVDRFRVVYLNQYLQEALFLLDFIGVTVFSKPVGVSSPSGSLIHTLDISTRLALGARAKADAIKFLSAKGIHLGKNINYAKLDTNKGEFWLNPRTSCLTKDWELVLNDTLTLELIVLRIPATCFSMQTDSQPGLCARPDSPSQIDLNLNVQSFTDRRSGLNFGAYVTHRVKYGDYQ